MFNKYHKHSSSQSSGFIALILVIMVTAIILVSNVIIGMVATSNNLANYHLSESEEVSYNIDACLDDALWRIASSTSVSGSYAIALAPIDCAYDISATSAGLKFVTSTATTTSALGNWHRGVVVQVNVSTTPMTIEYYKDNITSRLTAVSEGPNSATVATSELGSGSSWTSKDSIFANEGAFASNNCDLAVCKDTQVRLIKASNELSTTNQATTLALGGVANPGYTTYGGNGELWGESWSASDINSGNFGLAIKYGDADISYLKATSFNFNIPTQAIITGIKAEVEHWSYYDYDHYQVAVDHVRLTIYYKI